LNESLKLSHATEAKQFYGKRLFKFQPPTAKPKIKLLLSKYTAELNVKLLFR